MLVFFLHATESTDADIIAQHMSQAGHTLTSPALDQDFTQAIQLTQGEFNQSHSDIIVAAGYGGAIALHLDTNDTPLILLAPAWKKFGAPQQLPSKTLILHSRHDQIVPIGDSQELVSLYHLPPETLIEVGNHHALTDESTLSVLLWVIKLLTSEVKLPWSEDEAESMSASSRQNQESMPEEAHYTCDACGEEIVIPVDLAEGSHQSYVEDCPVCCRANIIHIQITDDGDLQVWSEPEQDHD
jgi:hypothetical protein